MHQQIIALALAVSASTIVGAQSVARGAGSQRSATPRAATGSSNHHAPAPPTRGLGQRSTTSIDGSRIFASFSGRLPQLDPLERRRTELPLHRRHFGRAGFFHSRFYAPFGFGYAPFGFGAYGPFLGGYDGSGGPFVAPAETDSAATGMLRLAVTPFAAQVFIDSYYVGTVEDINAQRVLALEAGPHRIEIRAQDYEALTFDMRIPPYETLTYRGALQPSRSAAPVTRAAPAAQGPMYVISNCYLGNVPPRVDRLPSGCDINRVQVLESK